MFLVPGLLARKISLKNLAKNWGISYLGNFAGCVFFMGLFGYVSGLSSFDPVQGLCADMGMRFFPFIASNVWCAATTKCNLNWGIAFLRAIGANWLVGLALYGAVAADDVVGRMVSLWVPVMAFAVMGFEHSIANMALITLGLLHGGAGGNVGLCLYNNLLPVTLGNIVGGGLFVGGAIYILYIHDDDVMQEDRYASQVVTSHMQLKEEQSSMKLLGRRSQEASRGASKEMSHVETALLSVQHEDVVSAHPTNALSSNTSGQSLQSERL